MTLDEFKTIDAKNRLSAPGIFKLAKPARSATFEMLETVERLLLVRLPERYREFLQAYGGGEYGAINIFSADEEDEWYLPNQQYKLRSILPSDYLAVSDDLCGGLYVLRVVGGEAKDKVYYWNFDDGKEEGTPFHDILEYVARYELGAA